MVMLPEGRFEMGGNSEDQRPVHQVTVNSFALGKTEVTQAQWRAVMGDNPSHFSSCGDDCPVEKVSWTEAQDFVRKLNQKTGKTYRLPSEAEWEYACRAGGKHAHCGGDDLDRLGWTKQSFLGETHPVARKQPNAWGLYDMSGNVWEWVEDCWNASYSGAPNDGSAWRSGTCSERVIRGVGYGARSTIPSAAMRLGNGSSYRDLGLRLARTLP
jgi:formylglycine-generating enzyme required for sulfatase activity